MPVTAGGKAIKLAMQDLFLTGKIMPVGARLMVKHTFSSAETKPIEVVYAFMLPRDAALRRFQITGKGFSSQSRLVPVKEARKVYEDGIEKGHLASLAQVYRDGVVNLNVGNIRPGETVTVLLEILAGVDLQDDSFRFRFPFTLAPTYHAKARAGLTAEGDGEIQLPEDEFGDVILPTFKKDASILHRVGFDLEVITPSGIAEVGSASHAVRISDLSGRGARVQLATDHALPNSDLVLDVRTKDAFTGVLAGNGKDGRCHFAGIVASPSFGKAKTAVRRLVFMLDRSGSMEGERIQQAKSAILACIGALGPKDQIGLVAFDTHAEVFRSTLALADQPTRDALPAVHHKESL
jgi:Ca-activated chloride channel family protein